MPENKVQLTIEAVNKAQPVLRELVNGFDEMKRHGEEASGSISGLFSVLSMKGAAVVGTIAGLAFGLKEIVSGTAEHGEHLLKYSQQLGISVESLDKLSKVASVSETSFEDITVAVGKLSKALQTESSTSYFADILKSIGLNINELKAMKPEDALIKLSEKFSELKDGSAKTALAMELFGRSGKSMIPLLNELHGQWGKFNASFNEDQARQADKYNDTMKLIEMRFQSLKHTIGNELLPVLNEFLARLMGEASEGQVSSLDKKIAKLFEERNKLMNQPGIRSTGDATYLGKITKELSELINKRNEMQKELAEENKRTYKDKETPKLPDKDARKKTDEWADALRGLDAQLVATSPGVDEYSKKIAEVDKTIGHLIQKFPEHKKELLDYQKALKSNIADQRTYDAMKAYYDSAAKGEQFLKDAHREGFKQSSAAEVKAYEERFQREQTLSESIIKSSEEVAIARTQRLRGSVEGEIKQFEIEKKHILEEAEFKKTAYDISAEERLQIEQETTVKLLALSEKYYEALQARSGTFSSGFDYEMQRFVVNVDTAFQMGRKMATETAQAMSQSFSDFFFDAMELKFKTLGDYVLSFTSSVKRALANALGQQVTGSIISSIGNLFAGGGSTPTTTVSATGSTPILQGVSGLQVKQFATGGYFARPTFLSNAMVAEAGSPEILAPEPMLRTIVREESGSAAAGTQDVNNYYYINAVDAKSFAELVERNPGAITKILHEDKRSGSSLWR